MSDILSFTAMLSSTTTHSAARSAAQAATGNAIRTAVQTQTVAQLAHALRSPRTLSLVVLLLVSPFAYIAWKRTQHEPSAEEMERERREFLAVIGRITDGNILETQWTDDPDVDTPHTLLYQYRVSGVTYECAQDVSALPEPLRHIRIDLPIQVRFDPKNPADSIVVAETWSGLRSDTHDATPRPDV